MNEYDYTGDKTKNYFTAYLQKCIRWKRWNYMNKQKNIKEKEKKLKNSLQIGDGITIEELLEIKKKEELLFREQRGVYPEWKDLTNQNLIHALLLLREEERRFIYQHVFEERSLEEIGDLNGESNIRIKNIYYYAIRKIRRWMGIIMDFEEILFRAKKGEQLALQQILEMYRPMLDRNSLINGKFDEDLYQELILEVLKCVQCFVK